MKGPFISNEPVICTLFVVATAEPVALNIPSVVVAPPPNDDVATNVALLPTPPTQAYPCANDAVNTPDADILPFTVNKLPLKVRLLSTLNPPGAAPTKVKIPLSASPV